MPSGNSQFLDTYGRHWRMSVKCRTHDSFLFLNTMPVFSSLLGWHYTFRYRKLSKGA
jgi:hypothetical protein